MTNTAPRPSEVAPEPDPWATVMERYPVGSVVTGTVRNLTDYGAFVDLAPGLHGMIHISDMSLEMVKLPSELVSVGQKLEVMILGVRPAQRRIRLGLSQKADSWKTVETKYAVGQKIQGKVIRVTDNGVMVELEPDVAGVVPATEISWAHLKTRPGDSFTLGQEVEALVLGIDCPKRRMSLSLRQLKPDPWAKATAKYPAGTKVKGTVYKLVTRGAFVEITEGICGLIHISEMSWLRNINHPSACLKKGDETEAVVLAVDPANRRLSLSIKRLVQDPWETIDQRYQVGDVVAGKIVTLATFGAFVELQLGLQGLIHISQISAQPVAKVKDVLSVGQSVSVRIFNIDREQRRIGLSLLTASGGAGTSAPSESTPSLPAPGESGWPNLGKVMKRFFSV